MATTISRTWYNTLVDDDSSGTTGSVWDKADVDALLDDIDALFSGGVSNTNNTLGLTLAQGANDDEILAFHSTDVNHGVTTRALTGVYGNMQKTTGPTGGLKIMGLRATGATGGALVLMGGLADAASTTKSIAGTGVVYIDVGVKSGTDLTAVGADGNLFAVLNWGTTRFILDADGDSHQDVGTAWTNFDAADDVALLHALSVGVSRRDDPIREGFGRFLTRHRRDLKRLKIVVFNRDGHHFINWSRAHMLTIGAVRQLGVKVARQERQLQRLVAKRHAT